MTNRRKWLWALISTTCLAWPLEPRAAAQQEPTLVGRIAHIEGEILRYVPETKDWVIAGKDAPFGLEDALYSDASAKAEFVFPNRLLARIGASTQIQLIVLKGDASEMDVASGVARFYNRNPEGMLKVTTPFGYVLAEPGSIFDLYAGDQSVEVLALSGRVDYFEQGSNAKYEVTPGGASILADATQVANGEGKLDAQWDDWNASRDAILAKRTQVKGESVRRLPPQLEDDAYDLDESGRWERVMYEGEYREVWRPTVVQESWGPFTVGRWTDYYGDQVWVPDEPFGYVTMHYGNWILVENRWYWAPPIPAVQVAAAGPFISFGWYPGRVAWISSGPNAGWVPLAPTEIYYSHHLWGPAAVVVAPGAPVISIAIGRLAFVSAAVIVPQTSFYSVTNYSSVRVTNINQTTIINNYHTAPVVNNTVINNYNQTTAKYNFVNKAPNVQPYSTVTQRVVQNQQVAGTAAKSVTASALRQTATSAKVAAPMAKAAVPPPTTLTNKLVPPNQVNAPKNQVSFKPVGIKQNTKPIAASPAIKAGGTSGRGTPGAAGVRPAPPGMTQPPPPASHQPAAGGGPAGARPEVQSPRTQPPSPGATRPAAPGITQPPPPAAHQPAAGGGPAGTRPEVQSPRTQPPSPGATRPPASGITQPPAATRPPAGGAGSGTRSPAQQPDKKKQPAQQ